MKQFLKDLMRDGSGVSSTRFALICGVAMIFFLVVLIGYIVFKQLNIEYIDKIVFAVGTIAGIFFAGKVTQKFAEQKEGKQVNVETTIEKATINPIINTDNN